MTIKQDTHIEDTRPIFVADSKRYDLPIGLFGKLQFDESAFLKNPTDFKALVLTGGEDVNPSLYGQKKNKLSGVPNLYRDILEMTLMHVAYRHDIPIWGICRGAQLLNIFAGGTLVQDCDNHVYWHNARTSEGEVIQVSSTHHQMMIPPDNSEPHEMLAWAEHRESTYYKANPGYEYDFSVMPKEPEAIYFPGINGLATQFHPEYMKIDSKAFRYALRLIQSKLGLRLASRKDSDYFISLPKPATSKQEALVQQAKLKRLSKRQLSKLTMAEWEKSYISNRKRNYMRELIPAKEAYILARKDLAGLYAQQKKEDLQKESPVRAAKASE